MYPVSARFLDAISSSHHVVTRVSLYLGRYFGASPQPGTIRQPPILSGSVTMTKTGDVKSTLELEVPGEWWDQVQPYGFEAFVERGVDYGDRTQEWVPLGYYRLEEAEQAQAPNGTVKVKGADRAVALRDVSFLGLGALNAEVTHRLLASVLVNGDEGGGQSTSGYGMFVSTPMPIIWDGYNPDQRMAPAGILVDKSNYDTLANLVNDQGCTLRFADTGELHVELIDGPVDAQPVYDVRIGRTGNLIKASRKATRKGVYSIVVAFSTGSVAPVRYRFAQNSDPDSPLYWAGPFGPVVKYYGSPLLFTASSITAAAQTVLSRYTGLPTELAVTTVPNPALRPNDLITIDYTGTPAVHQIDTVKIPLGVRGGPVEIKTVGLNNVADEEENGDA
jgi:hypothetical protein